MDKDVIAKLSQTITLEHGEMGADATPVPPLGSGPTVGDVPSTATAAEPASVHPGLAALMRERGQGRPLKDIIAASTPERRDERIDTPNQVVSIAIGACGSLAHAHRLGFVHQDVKPGNIFVGEFGEVQLSDWRSAIRMDDPAERRRWSATPLYMSPEQANHQPTDARTDVYCLGATLFEMLLLRPPNLALDEETLWAKKRIGAIDRPTDDERRQVPGPLLAVAMKALAADPRDRYQDAAAMLKALRDYQEGLATSAAPGSLNEWPMRWYRRNRTLFWMAAVGAVLLGAVSWMLAVEKAKERAQWRVVYDADFKGTTAKALDRSWIPTVSANSHDPFTPISFTSEEFAIDAKGLTIHGTQGGYVDVSYRNDLVGDVRVEWDYACDHRNLNYNCYIGGSNRWNSHMFHIGSWNNPAYAALTHGADYSVIDSDFLEHPLAAGHVYRFAMEQDHGRLRLLIDERVIFDLDNPSDIYGDRSNTFGFDAVGITDLRISHVRVMHKPLPQRISPLAVADSLLQMRDYPSAAQHYLDIENSYPGTELAHTAHFRYAISCLRAGDTAHAVELLGRLASQDQDDPQTPYACYELLNALGQQGDKKAISELLERFGHWQGHPVLPRVMAWIADSHLGELQTLKVEKVGDPERRPDIVACIKMTIAELQEWGHRYDVAWWKNTYAFIAGDVLRSMGDGSDVIANFPRQSLTYQSALAEAGRFTDVLELAPPGSPARAWALVGLGRHDEVLADAFYPEDIKWELYAQRGDLPKLLENRALVPSQWAKTLLLAGRYDEVIDQSPDPKTLAAALVALGRAKEIESRTNDMIAVSRGLVELREYDQLTSRFPIAYENLYLAAERQWFAGDLAAAGKLLADLDRSQAPLEISDIMFGRYVFPGVIKLISGTSTDPAVEFEPLIVRSRGWYQQQLWHQLSYIAGKIDDRQFLAQPDHNLVEERLLLAQAIANDVRGKHDEALAAYTKFAALPCFRPSFRECDRDFVTWRIHELTPR